MPFAIILLLFLTDKKVNCPRKIGFPGQLQVTKVSRATGLVRSACSFDCLYGAWSPVTLSFPSQGRYGALTELSTFVSGLLASTLSC